MRKGLIFLVLVLSGCAARIATMTEPTDDKNFIVIGSIILQNNGFTPETEVYTDGIDVLITGKITRDGKESIKDFWVVTDSQPFFVLSDVPPGLYALKAIRTNVGIDKLITIANSLRYSSSEFQLEMNERIPFGANHFPDDPVGRVVDLKHNIFMIDASTESTYKVQYRKSSKIVEARLVNNQILQRPSVAESIIGKFPESKWIPVLKNAVVK